VRAVGEGLILAIQHLHGLGFVHRDIKPDNIMFGGSSFDPVLVDFGLVRDLAAESLTPTWHMRGPGTPYFAPPEQLRNEKHLIDWRSDQFSVGLTLAYAAWGKHPFDIDGDPVENVANRGELSGAFRSWALEEGLSVLLKMVSVWPIHRYRYPADLLADWRSGRG
jgi:serine/threonine protein kinase